MEFRVLGPLEVIDDDRSPIVLSGVKERTLLAALLVSPGEVVSSDRLIDIVWSEELPANPLNALQARMSALRRSLGGSDVIVTQPPGYRLAVGSDDVDVGRFERLLGEARNAAGGHSPAAVDLYDQALSLWRGDPYADFAYQDFFRPEISRLEETRLDARAERIEVMLEAGRHAEILGELEALVVRHPLRERFWGQLMTALYREGRQAEALRSFREASRILGEELGIEPSRELRQLEEAILSQDAALSMSIEAVKGPRHNLPARLTSLVGRVTDTEQVTGLLEDHRLVTLIGPGGVGKTSLALACGEAAVSRFGDGVWLVELAAVSEGELVPAEIARSLGLGTGDRSTLEQVCDALRDRELLILVDNCEHLIDAVAGTASKILERAPEGRMIATSREPLGVPGEILWPTRPLAAPGGDTDLADLEGFDAVQLFVERASASFPDFALDENTAPSVSEICRRLDGLPLALELAAARVRNLSVAEIATRLDDRFRLLSGTARTVMPRQQTLEAAIAWSHDLLTEKEKALFQRLSVFAGDWSLAAAEALAPNSDEVIDLLGRLVDRSLVMVDSSGPVARYSMLETIRAYAHRKLVESGAEKEAALGHARWFLELAESAEFQGPEQGEWATRLSQEHDNLRIAVAHALRHGDSETAIRLGAALGWWWFFGNRDEGRNLLDQVLEATTDRHDLARVPVLHARALLDLFNPSPRSMEVAEEALATALALEGADAAALSKVYVALGGVFGPETERSLWLIDEALSVFQESGDRWGEGFAGFQRMEILAHKGDLRQAIVAGEAALACFRETGDPWAISAALAHLGRYGRLTGRLEWAEEVTGEALDLARIRRLPHTVQYVMTDHGYLHLLADDHDGAREIFEKALARAVDVGNPVGAATIRNAMAESHLTLGSVEDARRLHSEALSGFREVGLDVGVAYTEARLGLTAEVAGRLEEADRHHHETLRSASKAGAVIEAIPALEGLGRVAAAGSDLERAARLLCAGASLRSRSGLTALPVERAVTDSVVSRVRTDLGPEVFERIAEEVKAMDPAAVAAMAD